MATTEKIPFQSIYSYKEGNPNETGTEYDNTYHVERKDGRAQLIKDGKTNRYEKIQSYKEECLIENILAKATVDPTILNARTGQYGDFTKMPKTLMEAQNMTLRINQEFMKLPAEVRAKFGNSLDNYINTYAKKEWWEKLGVKQETKTETKVETKEETKSE